MKKRLAQWLIEDNCPKAVGCSSLTTSSLSFQENGAQIILLQRVSISTIMLSLYLASSIALQHMSLAQLLNSSLPKVTGPEAGCCCSSAPVILTFHAFFRKEKLVECEKSGTLTGCQDILQHKPTCQPACFLVYFKVSSQTNCSYWLENCLSQKNLSFSFFQDWN